MSRPLRILILNTQMEAGGAQKAMLGLAARLRRRGHDVTAATFYDKADFIPGFEQRFGLPILNLRMKQPGAGRLTNAARTLRGLVKLWRLMRRERFDVVQTFSYFTNVMVLPLAWLAGVPVRVSSQRVSLTRRPGWQLALDRWVANTRITHRMLSVSEGTRRFCIDRERINPDKLVTVRNGIDTHAVPDLSDDARQRIRAGLGAGPQDVVIGVVARLHEQKGHRYLLEALPGVLARHDNIKVWCAGDGDLKDAIEQQLEALQLTRAVKLLGSRGDVPELLAASDVFVLPSLYEGMPNVVLEALAAGLPVVATAVDGTPELVQHEQTAWLVPASDSDALREGLLALLDDPSRRHRLAAAGRAHVREHFDLETVVDRFEGTYHEFMPRHGEARA